MSKAKACIVAGACRWNCKQQPNEKARNGRTGDGESVLPDNERATARGEANGNCAERTCSSLICVDPCGQANEERERMDCKREQRPTEDTEPDDIEKNAYDEHGDGSRDKVSGVAPSTTTTALSLRLADPAGVWNPWQSCWRAKLQAGASVVLVPTPGSPLRRGMDQSMPLDR